MDLFFVRGYWAASFFNSFMQFSCATHESGYVHLPEVHKPHCPSESRVVALGKKIFPKECAKLFSLIDLIALGYV